MILQIFTVKDLKTEAYLPPFYLATKGAAIRSFSDTVNDPTHTFNKHPVDYVLFHLGEYNDSHATFEPLPAPLSLGSASDFLTPTQD